MDRRRLLWRPAKRRFLPPIRRLLRSGYCFASFDNLAITTFQEGVTEDLSEDQTAPVTQAQTTGDQTAQGAYINQATISLEAEDGESGVAGIHWQLNDGPVNEYEKPVVVSREGAFTLTCYAYDRAGNREAAKK